MAPSITASSGLVLNTVQYEIDAPAKHKPDQGSCCFTVNITQQKMYYLAYGSNLHPVRLSQRINSAQLMGVIQLSSSCLKFHKAGQDGSSKCNLISTNNMTDVVYAALYEMDREHKHILDKFEGRGFGYYDGAMTIQHRGTAYTCFTYLADPAYIQEDLQPYHWYKNLVLLGAKYLKFPETYVAQIETVHTIQDPHTARQRDMQMLIDKIIAYH